MFAPRAAATAALLAACAGATAPKPAPAPTAITIALAAPAPTIDAAPSACLRDLVAPTITLLDADARTVHVCFSATDCFAIDRRTSVITSRMPSVVSTSPLPSVRPPQTTVTIEPSRRGHWDVCAANDCVTVPKVVIDASVHPLSGQVDANRERMVLTLPGSTTTDPDRFVILSDGEYAATELKVGGVNRCGNAVWIGPSVLVTTDDCEGGNVHGILFDQAGKQIALVGGNHAIDVTDVDAAEGAGRWAIIAPRAYALVFIDLPYAQRQDVIDLVPIEAQPSATPHFTAKQLADGNWLVASPTGGVGAIDRTTLTFSKTWIIPRCEDAAAATGP